MTVKSQSYTEMISRFPLRPIKNEETYFDACDICVALAERFAELNEDERDYLDVLTGIVSKYEAENNEEVYVEPRELVSFLMEQNELKQKDLIPIFGSQARISEFLNGKRDLSMTQILGLAKRFNLSPAAFLPKSDDEMTPAAKTSEVQMPKATR